MKKYILSAVFLAFVSVGLQSCLDFDDPLDESLSSDVEFEDEVFHGKADSINYHKEISADGFAEAESTLKPYFGQMLTAQYAMRGGKEANLPGAHAYQYQFSLGVDNYAGYFCLPHNFDGRINSTYYINTEFNSGPEGSYSIVKNGLAPMLNHPKIDSIPEMKAIGLLLFDYASQEMADIYGPFSFFNYKENQQKHPFTYNSMKDIYTNIVDNLDTISACLKNYDNRPDWYKKKITSILRSYDAVTQDWSLDTWRRFANSLKLRMAMRVVKVLPENAKKWAEEAVKDGVIESTNQEVGLFPSLIGFTNPLVEISETWSDTRLNASFESLLMSLNHPYTEYLFRKNRNALINENDPTQILEPDTRIVGLRAGTEMIPGQSYDNNPRTAYSRLSSAPMANAPLYLMKLSEVDFLRAEGKLYGWDMGTESTEFFYYRGIDNAYVEDRNSGSPDYTSRLAAYKARESAVEYTYIDPMNEANNIGSVTKIGVKWNEGDDPEVKLEKIITQKYIALFPYSYEAWSEMRRKGYQKIITVLNVEDGDGSLAEGDLIRRMPFPGNTAAIQYDIANSGLEALGGDDLQATRLWWDVDAPNF